jgi:nucleotide-binding universal stress UspA family protein
MTILAAIDLSPSSIDAARAAVRLARRLGDRLLLLRVVEPVSAFYPELMLVGAPDLDADIRKANVEALQNVRAALEADDLEVELQVVAGRPAEAIIDSARQSEARLIVMGTHGRGATARLLLGSITQKTILHATCAVLVVREGSAPFSTWTAGRPLRVLAGIDHGPSAAVVLDWLRPLRAAGPLEVTLAHEYWPAKEYARLGLQGPRDVTATDAEVVATLERELRADLAGAGWPQLTLGAEGDVRLRISAVRGPIGEQLAIDAEAAAADLMAVVTTHPHGWDRLKSGSTAISALTASRVPLLAIPTPGA